VGAFRVQIRKAARPGSGLFWYNGGMGIFGDLRILYHMAVRPVRGKSHAERMDNFYSGQAADYDDFRRRLLRGREDLWQKMLQGAPYNDTIWMDMGGGTGSNLHFFGEAIDRLQKVYVVDLAGSLLSCRQAHSRERLEKRRYRNRRCDHVHPAGRFRRCHYLFLFADHDPRLVCSD